MIFRAALKLGQVLLLLLLKIRLLCLFDGFLDVNLRRNPFPALTLRCNRLTVYHFKIFQLIAFGLKLFNLLCLNGFSVKSVDDALSEYKYVRRDFH
jgi:hypothetical protein